MKEDSSVKKYASSINEGTNDSVSMIKSPSQINNKMKPNIRPKNKEHIPEHISDLTLTKCNHTNVHPINFISMDYLSSEIL